MIFLLRLLFHVYMSVLHRDDKQLHVEDAGTADVVRGKVSLIQQNLDDVNRYWNEQTDGLYLGPDGKVYTRDGKPFKPRDDDQEGETTKRQTFQPGSSSLREIYGHLFCSFDFVSPHDKPNF